MGFGSACGDKNEQDLASILPQVQTEDILEFGLIPELVGRLPVISSLSPLDHAGLVRVLTEPKNALLKQYQTLFEMEDSQLEFSESALQAIAMKALNKGTGARGLRSIVEHVMVDIMYELPDQPKGTKYVIDQDIVLGRRHMFPIPEPMQKSA
jgi:ATP-dependent Clp protease ATP-binding subunit ClpX